MLIPIIRFFEDEEVGTEPMESAKSCFLLAGKMQKIWETANESSTRAYR
jgi:hypothetical protein